MTKETLYTIKDLLEMWLSAGSDEDDSQYLAALEEINTELKKES
jgi:hypothetical protein